MENELFYSQTRRLKLFSFGSQAVSCDTFNQALTVVYKRAYQNFWACLVKGNWMQHYPEVEQAFFYESLEQIDVSSQDFRAPSLNEVYYVPGDISGSYQVKWSRRQPSHFERLISDLYDEVHPRLQEKVQQAQETVHAFSLNLFSLGASIYHLNSSKHPDRFWTNLHQCFIGLILDTVTFLIEHHHPALVLLDETGENEDETYNLNTIFSANFVFSDVETSNDNAFLFLSELEKKYADLPIGVDLYRRSLRHSGQDRLDLLHNLDGYLSPRYQSFSLWQLLRKKEYHERYHKVPYSRIWSYAMDLGLLVFRLVAINIEQPLGARILDELSAKQVDLTYRLYREFYIYRKGNYLLGILRDTPYLPWAFSFDDKVLEEVPLDWRPQSLMGYDYSDMELLYVPPKRSKGEHSGWFFRESLGVEWVEHD